MDAEETTKLLKGGISYLAWGLNPDLHQNFM